MPARMVPRLAICLMIGVLVAGCGAGSSAPRLSATAARQLQNDLTAARTGAERHSREAADAALARFAAGVRRAARDGQLSRAVERRLEDGLAQARRHVSLDVTTPTPPPSTVAQTTPAPALTPPTPAQHPGEGPNHIPPGHAQHGDHGHQQGDGGG